MNPDPKNWSFIAGIAPDSSGERAASEFADAQMALSAPRHLMTALRALTAEDIDAQAKLDRVVALVATELRADACACFVLRAGEMLELFSAAGLPADLVHSARVRVGEGIVGDIAAHAAPIVVPDLSAPGPWAPGPETGAGALKAFCGVPVLRGGRVRGVLTLQTARPRAFGEEAVDILQTVAMVVAELIVAGGLVSRLEMNSGGFALSTRPTHLNGTSLGRGLAIGAVVLYEPDLAMQDIVADDAKEQKKRLQAALSSMYDAIDRMLNRNAVFSGSESRDILEAYQMFAKDRGWLSRIEATIDKGLSAEAAVQRVQNETRARMMQINDPYIRERLHDLEDLSNRLLSHLARQNRALAPEEEGPQPDSIVLVARALGPAALLDYDRSRLKGVILEKGGHSDHVAIVARSLGVPIVGQCADIRTAVAPGDQVIVDGDHGVVYINPSDDVFELYTRSIEARTRRSALYRRQTRREAVTKDGIRVSVMVNAGMLADVEQVHASGGDGIGLFRTELSFMGFRKYPLVVTQAELYGKIMDQMEGRPVTFRTLDIGGDKPLPYFTPPVQEENPAMGWRAVRIGMDRPAVLRTQFRAFIRAAKGRPLRIMLPFVTEVAEFDRARQLLDMETTRAREHGTPAPERLELGVMLEVPALLWQLEALLQEADFLSVGSNDLMQYLFAADRSNFAIRRRYDALSPAMLKVLKTIADACKAAGKPLSLCGEMAGHPLEAMVLIALGYDTLSVPPSSVEAVRMMVPTLDTQELLPYLESLMRSREHSLRERLTFFARDHNVDIFQTV